MASCASTASSSEEVGSLSAASETPSSPSSSGAVGAPSSSNSPSTSARSDAGHATGRWRGLVWSGAAGAMFGDCKVGRVLEIRRGVPHTLPTPLNNYQSIGRANSTLATPRRSLRGSGQRALQVSNSLLAAPPCPHTGAPARARALRAAAAAACRTPSPRRALLRCQVPCRRRAGHAPACAKATDLALQRVPRARAPAGPGAVRRDGLAAARRRARLAPAHPIV